MKKTLFPKRPSPCLSIRGGHLFLEECDTVDLAVQFGTPLFAISEQQLRDNVRGWQRALGDAWPEGGINVLPSIKANTCLALRHILTQEGAGCDTFGPGELTAALRCGVAPELISVNGSAKNRALLRQAIASGARITLDHKAELPIIRSEAARLNTTAHIRLRLRLRSPDLGQPSDLAPHLSASEVLRIYKPGIAFEQAVPLGRSALAMPEIDLAGLHIHIARNSSHLDYWERAIQNFVHMVADLHREWDGWLPRELDLGGGYSYPYDPAGRGDTRVAEQITADELPGIDDYTGALTGSVRNAFINHGLSTNGMTLEIEPGRAMYGNTGIHLTRVCDIKTESEPKPWRWVETDTSEIFLSGIGLEHADFPVIVANKADSTPSEQADIVGISCNFDLLVSQVILPPVASNDVIAFLNTGAYEEVNGSNFNLLARPATVLVNGNSAEVIRRRETIDEILARDVIPARFVKEVNRKAG
jgi:diaminopimelate decarboxylase